MADPEKSCIFSPEKLPLPEVIARHLLAEGAENSWDDLLLIVSTAETGRRVIDALVAKCSGRVIFPPRVATPLSLVPFGKGEGVATALQAQLAWSAAFRAGGDFPLTFGPDPSEGSRSSLAGAFVALTRTLAAAGRNIAGANELLAVRDARWQEWLELWKSYRRVLESAGLICPAEAQIAAAESFALPPGVSRVLVGGVTDLSPLARRALDGVPGEILIHAPGVDVPAAFDSTGTPRPDFWKTREIPISQIEVLGRFEDVVARTAELTAESNESTAIICGDAGLATEIATRIEESGGAAFLPDGFPLSRHPVPRLAAALCRLAGGAEWEEMEMLMRHPDFLEWVAPRGLGRVEDLRQWTKFGSLALRPALRDLEERWAALSERERKNLGRVPAWMAEFHALAARLEKPRAARTLRELLGEIYGARDLNQRPGDKEAAKAVVQMLDEILPELGDPDAGELALLMDQVPGAWSPDKDPEAVNIEGWLELAGENASRVILAGLNEGLLPGRRKIDPLLPDSARSVLGLDDSASREIRDAALLHAAQEILGERLMALSVQQAADGTPLKPSRFLLRIPDTELPDRILRLCRDMPSAEAASTFPFSKLPLRVPRPSAPATAMSVTDFAAYLACPLRFYFSRRLGMGAPEDVSPRLESSSFGSWIHLTLQAFGGDPAIRNSANADEIREYVLKDWDSRFEPFGNDVDLYLQREAGRMRLERFAEHQAQTRRDGWEIVDVESRIHSLEESLQIPGWPLALRGRMDRLDRRGEALRLIDYKTGGPGSAKPEQMVRSRALGKIRGPEREIPDFARFGDDEVWADLQLPLYALALRAMGQASQDQPIVLSYFLLPDDPEKSGLYEWTPETAELESAARCAQAIMSEVAADAVCDWIASGHWERFANEPEYDDYEALALQRFVDAAALEMKP